MPRTEEEKNAKILETFAELAKLAEPKKKLSATDVAGIVGIGVTAAEVRKLAQRVRFDLLPQGRPVKIPKEKHSEVRAAHAEGQSVGELAKTYGTSLQTVKRVLGIGAKRPAPTPVLPSKSRTSVFEHTSADLPHTDSASPSEVPNNPQPAKFAWANPESVLSKYKGPA